MLVQIADLSLFLVKYRIRYENLSGVEEIVDAQNELARMKNENTITEGSIKHTFDKLVYNLDKLMSYFLVTIE